MVLYIFVAMAKKAKPAKEDRKNAGALKQDSEPTLEVKQLLKDEGVIFVSIDENEAAQLRLLMDEVFGEENFITKIVE